MLDYTDEECLLAYTKYQRAKVTKYVNRRARHKALVALETQHPKSYQGLYRAHQEKERKLVTEKRQDLLQPLSRPTQVRIGQGVLRHKAHRRERARINREEASNGKQD